MFKGIAGLSGIYKERPPAFLSHSGRKAAKMRSADLSRLAARSARFMDNYPCGQDDEAIRRQSRNKQAIQAFFGITYLEWNDWKWQTRRDADTMGRLVACRPGSGRPSPKPGATGCPSASPPIIFPSWTPKTAGSGTGRSAPR